MTEGNLAGLEGLLSAYGFEHTAVIDDLYIPGQREVVLTRSVSD